MTVVELLAAAAAAGFGCECECDRPCAYALMVGVRGGRKVVLVPKGQGDPSRLPRGPAGEYDPRYFVLVSAEAVR